ncbi:ROK family protein [Streptomyces crystallinus]|uniref:ROK family protein n=1 Tax=Streptomyces crystallinus TaxID=68191 RepID=A0ABN1FNB6_9ACTN
MNDPHVQQILRRSYELDHGYYAVGVELLPYKLVGVMAQTDGRVTARAHKNLTVMEPQDVVEHIAELTAHLVADALGSSFPRRRICLGVQLGGPVDTSTGLVRRYANPPDDHGKDKPPPYAWVDFPLGTALRTATGCVTAVDNDAHAFAAYEQRFGVGTDSPTFGVVLIRDGVGAGMVVQHERLAVPLEFGHLRASRRGRLCDCGMRGCIESQAGARALTAVVRERTGCRRDGLEGAIGLAESDEPQAAPALSAFRSAGAAIAFGIGQLLSLFGPAQMVVYAARDLITPGPGRLAANAFLHELHRSPTYAFQTFRECQVVPKPLQPVLGAHGAALIALQNCFGVRLRSR